MCVCVCALLQQRTCDTHYCTARGRMVARRNPICRCFNDHDMCTCIHTAHRWPSACVNAFVHGCMAAGDCQGVRPREKSTIRQRRTPGSGRAAGLAWLCLGPDASFGALRWAENRESRCMILILMGICSFVISHYVLWACWCSCY